MSDCAQTAPSSPRNLSHELRVFTAFVAVNMALPFILAQLVRIGPGLYGRQVLFFLAVTAIFVLNESMARAYPEYKWKIRGFSFLNLGASGLMGLLGVFPAILYLPSLLKFLLG